MNVENHSEFGTLASQKLAAASAAGSIATGIASWAQIIQPVLGCIASLIGIILSATLIYVNLKRLQMDVQSINNDIQQNEARRRQYYEDISDDNK